MAKLYNPDPELDMFYRSDTCTVYLLHAARPVFGAQHYAGSTEDLERRLREHRRVWPLYRFDDVTFNDLVDVLPKTTLENSRTDRHGEQAGTTTRRTSPKWRT
jgi:hypothetical protein